MNELNGLKIQEILYNEESVSIPWLQQKFSLSYSDAKRFSENMLKRGWVEMSKDGLRFKVNREYMKLRKLKRSEVDDIYHSINRHNEMLLSALRQTDGMTLSEVEAKLKSDDDAEEAIEVLKKLNLIYCFNGLYFRCVSDETIEIIHKVTMRKRLSSADELKDADLSLRKLFDPLFD